MVTALEERRCPAPAPSGKSKTNQLRILIAILAVALFGLVFAAPANATTWHWAGTLPTESNNNCVWYYYAGSCSAFNPWTWHETSIGGITLSKSLTGFENYDTIRGQWIYPGQTRGGDPSYYSMSGSLKAHVTWWDYANAIVNWANAWT